MVTPSVILYREQADWLELEQRPRHPTWLMELRYKTKEAKTLLWFACKVRCGHIHKRVNYQESSPIDLDLNRASQRPIDGLWPVPNNNWVNCQVKTEKNIITRITTNCRYYAGRCRQHVLSITEQKGRVSYFGIAGQVFWHLKHK